MENNLPSDRLGNPSITPATLTPGGIFDVAPEVLAWADQVAANVRDRLSDRPVRMHLRAYRTWGREHLSCDFADGTGELEYIMTFIVDDGLWLDPTEPRTPDLTEALFLAGLLAERLSATTLIDTVLG